MIHLKGLLFGLALVLCTVMRAFADDAISPATQFGREIAGIVGRGTASLSIRNQSLLPVDEIPAIRRAVEAELYSRGIQLKSGDSASVIRITLSENVQGWVWIAEVRKGDDTRVAIVTAPRSDKYGAAQSGPSVILRKTFLFAQSEPMMDVATAGSGDDARLLVLEQSTIVWYRLNEGQWEKAQTFPIRGRAFPRDLRGRLVLGENQSFSAHLPGLVCTGDASSASCRESDDPWPLGTQKAFFNSARNYFTGVLVPGLGRQMPPFYAAADLPRPGYSLWAFSGIDGVVRLSDSVNERTLSSTVVRDWGSDMATVYSHCGTGAQLLVTSSLQDQESLRAYEVADREPVLVSAPLMMEGPVTALWPSKDAASATAIVRNISTGRYEAYSISVACSR